MAGLTSSVFLYGPPGSGKSTVGQGLGDRLNRPFIDLDAEIERQTNLSIPEIFASKGEPYFRKLEQEVLAGFINRTSAIFALGGGTLLDDHTRAQVESIGQVICLQSDLEDLVSRLETSQTVRPLLNGDLQINLESLLEKRAAHYRSFQIKCQTTNLTADEVIWEIQKMLGWFHIGGNAGGYDVRIGHGELGLVGQTLVNLGIRGQVFLVTDQTVAPLHSQVVVNSLGQAGCKVYAHAIPAGEKYKNLKTIETLWNAFLDAGLDRSSTVIALGGGVVGDLTGFAASTYMRGIDWINLPTTLLAMVDASVGGKTGIDLPRGKNLVGAFHSPKMVVIDPGMLSTLPEHELRSGMAEVVKHGVIDSPDLFDRCKSGIPANPTDLEELIIEAISVKVKVIQEDPFEKGKRAVLNFGHTIGHAIELVSDFTVPHGNAVAIGMVIESRLAQHAGMVTSAFITDLEKTLSALNLPTEVPEYLDHSLIIQAMANDKKSENGDIRFALPAGIGQVKHGIVIEGLDTALKNIMR